MSTNGSAPQWFVDALAAPVETGKVEAAGATIAYRAWGEAGQPGIVLVHGGMAHSGWWDHIGPQLARGRRVVALDLSGHGDSDHRDHYDLETWSAEILVAAEGGGIDRNVDQIRDILFGGQMRDYERRFQELNQRLEAELARLRETQDKRLAQIDKRVDDQLEKLGKQLRQEVQDRTGAIDDLESRIQQAARTSRSEINKALEGLAHDLAASDERLREAIAELNAAVGTRAEETESALSRASAELRAEKVGRDDLAALLTEFALRLRGDFDLPMPK